MTMNQLAPPTLHSSQRVAPFHRLLRDTYLLPPPSMYILLGTTLNSLPHILQLVRSMFL